MTSPTAMPKTPQVVKVMLATYGVIEGGRLDGWRYLFQKFTRSSNRDLRYHLTVNEPNWPFPSEVVLKTGEFHSLRAVKGERAPRFDAAALAKEAPVLPPTEREIAAKASALERLRGLREGWLGEAASASHTARPGRREAVRRAAGPTP